MARTVWLTDRWGVQIDDANLVRVGELLDAIAVPDGDEEHCTVSVTDSDAWNLEFSTDRVLFENLEGDEIGRIRTNSREERLAIAGTFLRGDLDEVRGLGWNR